MRWRPCGNGIGSSKDRFQPRSATRAPVWRHTLTHDQSADTFRRSRLCTERRVFATKICSCPIRSCRRVALVAWPGDIIQELLEVWPVGGPTGVPAIVIAGSDQGPSGVGLALDIGRNGIVLLIQRVELLVKPMLSRDPRIDGAADRPYGRSLHGRVSIADRSSRRPKKRGPFHLVPVIAKGTLERP